MNRVFKFFLITFVFVLLFWGSNIFQKNLEDFLFWREMVENPQLLASNANLQILEEKLINLKPLRNWQIEELKIEPKSAISVLIDNEGKEKVLFQKNSTETLPIASLTKLMTADIVLENYNLSQEIQVDKKSATQEGETGKLKIGKKYSVKSLLYPLLIESSNGAAFLLANNYQGMSEEKFVELMNLKASELGLKNTKFVNSSGLDPDDPEGPINYSTVQDLFLLTKHLLEKPLIWEILSISEIELEGEKFYNRNKLLGKLDGVIGGKTGYTEMAEGCMILVLEAPKERGIIINVILGSKDRFNEMEKLINWLKLAYKW
jgi:D-alanyl-D-alanine carboxypeptidase